MPKYLVPVYAGTGEVDSLMDDLDRRGESVEAMVVIEGHLYVKTGPPSRGAAPEKRPASKKRETRITSTVVR